MKIFKVTGVLFTNERGFEVQTEEFEVLDQNDKKIILKDADFTTIWKEETKYGNQVDKTKFDSSYELYSVTKGVGYFLESKEFKKEDAVSLLAFHFESKINAEIEERKNWLKQINK